MQVWGVPGKGSRASRADVFKEATAEEAFAAVGIGGIEGTHLAERHSAHGFIKIKLYLVVAQVGAGGMHGRGAVAGLGHHALGQGDQGIGDGADDGAARVKSGGFLALVAKDEAVFLQIF